MRAEVNEYRVISVLLCKKKATLQNYSVACEKTKQMFRLPLNGRAARQTPLRGCAVKAGAGQVAIEQIVGVAVAEVVRPHALRVQSIRLVNQILERIRNAVDPFDRVRVIVNRSHVRHNRGRVAMLEAANGYDDAAARADVMDAGQELLREADA